MVGVLNCIVFPLAGVSDTARFIQTLSVAYVIVAAYPINTAAHYRLFSRSGRSKYKQEGRDYPYITDQEWMTLIVTFVTVGAVMLYISR